MKDFRRFVLILGWMLLSGQVFAVEKFPQRVQLQVSKETENTALTFVVYRRILSQATNFTRLVLVSPDSNEQRQLGVKNIHARVILNFTLTNGMGLLTLAQADANQTNVFDSVIVTNMSGWIPDIDDLSARLLSKISINYPMKDKHTLQKLEIKVRKLSSFEPVHPKFTVRFQPLFLQSKIEEGGLFEMANGESYDKYKEDVKYDFGGGLGVEWHYLNWQAGAEFIYLPYGNVFSFYGATGFFGSLVMLGVGVGRQEAKFDTIQQWVFSTSTTNVSVTMPSFHFSKWSFLTVLQINMRPGYFFRLTTANADFSSSYSFYADGSYSDPMITNVQTGGPMMDLMLNIEVFKDWNVLLRYASVGTKFYTDTERDNIPDPYTVTAFSGGTLKFREMHSQVVYYGLGVEHVF